MIWYYIYVLLRDKNGSWIYGLINYRYIITISDDCRKYISNPFMNIATTITGSY